MKSIRVNEEFENSGSGVKKPKNHPCTKRTAENLNDLKNMMEEGFLISVRQAALKMSFRATTTRKMLRIDAKTKFFLKEAGSSSAERQIWCGMS